MCKRPCQTSASSSIVSKMRTLLALFVTAAVLLKGLTTWAVEPAERHDKDPFEGIESLLVVVDFAENDELSLDRKDIIAATKLELRKNGVMVTNEFNPDFVHVVINSIPIKQVGVIAFSVKVALCSIVTRSNGIEVFGAETWNSGSMGISSRSTAPATIREALQKALVDFCNLYLAANPKGAN
jgi:hypothetical protein